MITTQGLPHLKVYTSKVYLPVSKDNPLNGNVVVLNSRTLDGSINMITNKRLYHNNKYKRYFVDSLYRGKLFTKTYKLNLRKKRKEEYKTIKTRLGGQVAPALDIDAVKGRNFYFDIRVYNEVFFKYTVGRHFKARTKSYAGYLQKLLADQRLSDFEKLMLIDTRDWVSDYNSIDVKKLSVTNPIFILFYLMKYDLETFKAFGDIDIIFTDGSRALRANPKLFEKDSWQRFKRELLKLTKDIIPESDNEEEIIKSAEIREAIHEDVKTNILRLTGNALEDESSDDKVDIEDLEERDSVESEDEEFASREAEKIVDDIAPTEDSEGREIVANIMDTREFISQIYQKNKEKELNPSNKASIARDKKLREEVMEIKLDGKKLGDIEAEGKMVSLSTFKGVDRSKRIKSANKNCAVVRYPEFDKQYIHKVMNADYMAAFNSLKDKSLGLTIISVDVKDSSDELNYKETLKVVMEDRNRVRHTVTVDLPKIIDDRFIFLGGNKKILYKQKFPYPITKTGPDKVQICTNYNKMFISRYGLSVTENVEKFDKFAASKEISAKVKRGNNRSANSNYITTFEYDEIASRISSLSNSNYEFIFNINNMVEKYPLALKDINENKVPYGYDKKEDKIISIDADSQLVVGTDLSPVEFIVSKLSPNDAKIFDSFKGGTKFIHSRATLMKKNIPLFLLLAYCESLSGLLRVAGIEYRFSEKKPNNLARNERLVRFDDGYFIYKVDKFATELLMNGISVIPTRALNFSDLDVKDTYIDIFESLYGTRIIGNALDNFYECLLDPKSIEILEYLNYPTDFTRVVLFANELLSDNNHLPEDSMEQFRIRSFEMFTGMLYKGVADAYAAYRVTANNNNPVKVSLPRDYLIKKIVTSQVVEDYSDINPITEMEKVRTITPKGHSGLNLDRAYTIDKRTYSPTMKGIYALATSPDANVGVSRVLTLEPNIKNIYGMVDMKPDSDLNDTNMFSPGELLSPLGASTDDSIRTSMALKQSKHMISVDKQSPVLISNGTESVIPYHLSKDFVIVATDNGSVTELNDEVAVLTYDDGRIQAIDLRARIAKNSGGGFFLSYRYKMNFKLGEKFKKDDIVAQDSKFFKTSKVGGTDFNIGSLQKVAIMPTAMTIEDSAEITNKISKDMASEIVKKISVVLPASANVDYICKENQSVKTGELLIKFDSSTTDADVAKFLANVGAELQEEILSLSKNKIKSKVTGVVEKINIYATVDLEDLSPSLNKIVKAHYNANKRFMKTVDKHLDADQKTSIYRAGMMMTDTVEKTEPTAQNKVKGEIVDNGVLIEFYVKYKDYMALADKGAFFTALKFEVSNIIPEGYEPYSEYRPDEEVSSFIGTSAIIARKTPSIVKTIAGNKAMVELKRSLWEMRYGKKWNEE